MCSLTVSADTSCEIAPNVTSETLISNTSNISQELSSGGIIVSREIIAQDYKTETYIVETIINYNNKKTYR